LEVLGSRLWLVSHEGITSGSPTKQFEICGSGTYFRGIWLPECGGHGPDRHNGDDDDEEEDNEGGEEGE